MELATFPSIGIDPDFEIHRPLPAPTRLFKQTDDNLFRDHDLGQLLGGASDLAFIDGMHRSQFVLRDFINLEHHAHPGSVILVDDLLTEDMSWTTRERKTQAWTVDVYKLSPLLMRDKPDLNIAVFDTRMKGIAIITGLNPQNTVLQDAYTSHESFLCGPDMEVNGIAESSLVPESADTYLHRVDATVDALRKTVVGFQDHRVDNAPQVVLQRTRHFLHGRKTATNHPVDQPLPAL